MIKGKMSSRMQSDYTPEQVLKLKEKLETEEKAYNVSSNGGLVGKICGDCCCKCCCIH